MENEKESQDEQRTIDDFGILISDVFSPTVGPLTLSLPFWFLNLIPIQFYILNVFSISFVIYDMYF